MKKNLKRQPAVFVDRDGTLIEEVNYLSRVEELRLFPFTRSAVAELKAHGFLIIVVTNQSGIGRNIFEETAMHNIHESIQENLAGAIDAFYFCPHLPCDGCNCRKPGIGMIESALEDFDIDLEGSWMVGDKKSDVELGRNAGLKSVLVLTGYGQQHKDILESLPEAIEADLGEAAKCIVDRLS
jgi:D-glycero-D-manno-heptose 1,7-bisphosphate phosphatase